MAKAWQDMDMGLRDGLLKDLGTGDIKNTVFLPPDNQGRGLNSVEKSEGVGQRLIALMGGLDIVEDFAVELAFAEILALDDLG